MCSLFCVMFLHTKMFCKCAFAMLAGRSHCSVDMEAQSSNKLIMCYYTSSRSTHNTWALSLDLPYLKQAQCSNNAQSTLSNLSSLLATEQR